MRFAGRPDGSKARMRQQRFQGIHAPCRLAVLRDIDPDRAGLSSFLQGPHTGLLKKPDEGGFDPAGAAVGFA